MSLNSAQIQAIAHKEGPCMVLAGPGSGKTTVITRRIAYLVEKHKVNPEEILVVTFSKAASKEMKERFFALCGGNHYPITFGTFHGIYYGILKWAYKLTSANIFSDEEKYQVLQKIAEHDDKTFLQELADEISCVKNNGIQPEQYESVCCDRKTFLQLYYAYEEERNRMRKIDFDDMLVLAHELFVSRPDILEKWQEKYSYILVDEFQDINPVQYEVLRMLAKPHDNLFIVGDDDQSIYGFRGAKPDIMLQFPNDYPNTATITLDVNYRSTKAIVSGATRVISHNRTRYPKQLVTKNESGVTVHVQEARDSIEESKYVIGEIQKELKKGVPANQIAILFRTNTEARTFIESCLEYNIPFQMKELVSNLYEHFIAENMITYMNMALGDRSRRSFLSIMNCPNRYIARESIEKPRLSFEELRKFYADKEWMQDRIDQWEEDLRVIKQCAPYAAIQYIKKRVGYDEFLKEYVLKRNIPYEDLQDVLGEIEERAKEYKSIEEWFAHIEEYTRKLHIQQEYKKPNPNAIELMTMHGAKGLEFDKVFIIGANEGITPYKKAKTKDELEEERRLFYVAMTRAGKRLVISYSRERGGKKMKPSRFVMELMGQ